MNIEQVASAFKPSQIHPSATAAAVETAVELGRWFHASYQNTVGARALVQKFKTERSNLILLPRPCVKEAADLISRETRAHVYLGEVIEACCFPGSAGASPVALSANMCEKGVRTQP